MKKFYTTVTLITFFTLRVFSQVSYLGLDGGFEGSATIDNSTTYAGAQAGKWSKNNATTTIANETSTVRSGNNSIRINNSSATGRRVYSPNIAVSTTNQIVIQYYRRVANTTNCNENQVGINRNATESLSGAYAVPATANTWEKVTYSPVGVNNTTNLLWTVFLTRLKGTGGDEFFDDVAMYDGTAPDVTAASAPTVPVISGQTNTAMTVSWTAAAGGVDGGGYMVVRGLTDPTTTPNSNGIYAVGNTTAAGETVVYLGTGVTFNDAGLTAGTVYYYRIYTYDKAYNYSAALTTNGSTTGCSTPITQTTAINFSATTPNSTTVSWTNGNGSNRIIVAKLNATIAGTPSNLTTYAGNTAFGSGATIAANEYVVYNGSSNTANLTNLTGGAAYNFTAFEFNCTGGSELYYTTSPPTANLLVPPNLPGSFAVNCGNTGTITITWNTPAGFYDNVTVFGRQTLNPSHNPSGAGSGYTGANSNITLATTYGGTDQLVYSGTGNSVTVTGLTAGQIYYFRAYAYKGSLWSSATSINNAYVGVENTSMPSVTTGNGVLNFTWTNPACYDSISVWVTDNVAYPTVTPTGDGSLYFDDIFYGNPASEVNSPANEFCVYKGTGTLFTLFGLTNTVNYKLKIFTRKGTNWSSGVQFNGTPTTATGDYQSNGTGGGNWNDNTTWQIWNGSAWVATVAGQFPNVLTESVTVLSGDVVVVPYSTGPYSFASLTIASGGKVYCNNGGANNTYLQMFVQINCNGTLGNGNTYDALSLNVEGPSTGCAIGGTGSITLTRIRKNLGVNSITKLNINTDVNLSFAGASLYNQRASSTFNVVVSAGSTVSTVINTGNLSIDGVDGTNGTLNRGTFTVFGTLNFNGIYYLTTDNTGAGSICNFIIKNGGIVNVNSVDASASASSTSNLTVESGGLFNITGTSGFTAFSTTNNVFNCLAGSTVEYSAAGSQTVESGITYQGNLKYSGSGDKTTNGNLTVGGNLVIDAAVCNAAATVKNLNLGGNLTLQNGGTMNNNCKDFLNITTSSATANQTFTGNSQIIKCLNLTSVKTAGSLAFGGAAGNSDAYIKNDLLIDHTSTAVFTDNGNTLSVGDDAQLGSTTSTSANFNLTGILKFVCIGAPAATDIHLSDYAGTGVTKAHIGSIICDPEAGSNISTVQFFPSGGGQTVYIDGSSTILNTNASTILNPNNNTISLKGNWSDYAASGFTEGTGQVVFAGTAAQTISTAETFNKLEINNANGVTLSNNTIATSELKLTNGTLTTGANEMQVTSNATGSVTGQSNASYVKGNLRRTVASTGIYDFPVGDSNYQLATLKLNSSTGISNVLAFFTSGLPSTIPVTTTCAINGSGIYAMLNGGFWTVTPDNVTTVNYDITLNQRGYSNFAGNANELGVIKRHDNTVPWLGTNATGGSGGTQGYHSNATQTIASGTATAKRTGVQSFSDFGVGIGGEPLPVTLTSFTLTNKENKIIDLNWNTAAEINCSYYIVERSEDGNIFKSIGKIAGHGTSDQPHNYLFTDVDPLCAVSYYRLQQVDFSTEKHFSNILSADISCGGISVTPNLVLENLKIKLLSESLGNYQVSITNVLGETLINSDLNFSGEDLTLDVTPLSAGLYFIKLTNGTQIFNERFFKQ